MDQNSSAGAAGAAVPTGAVVGGGDADPAGRLGHRVVEALATALVPPAPAGGGTGAAASAAVRDLVALCEVIEAPPDAAVNPLEVGAVTALALGELDVARRLLELARPVGMRGHRVGPLAAWVDLRRGAATSDPAEAAAPGATTVGEDPDGASDELTDEPGVDRAAPAGQDIAGPDGRRAAGTGAAAGAGGPGAVPAPTSAAPDEAIVGRLTVGPDAGADGAVLVGLAAGAARARRTGDVAVGGASARRLAEVLPVTRVDLLNFDAAIELVVLARRFGPAAVAAQLEERLDAVLQAVGRPAAWRARLEWGRLEAAVAARDGTALTAATDALAEVGPALWGVPRLAPLARAAVVWQEVMSGRADAAQLEAVVAELRDAGLGWEASQLAGQAAIRVDDAAQAKSLLGRARALRSGSASVSERVVTPAGLSEREVEVARLVLDGLTHKDIGSTLYISPKTVEHHVAHIRQKLGATTRAEFLALLREDLAAGFDA